MITVDKRHQSYGYDVTLDSTHFEPDTLTLFSLSTPEVVELINALEQALAQASGPRA